MNRYWVFGLASCLALASACGGSGDSGFSGAVDGSAASSGTGGGNGGSGNAAASGGSGNASATGGSATGGSGNQLRFFSAEYQTFQCTTFNDYYLAMLTTGAAAIPADHNISFDAVNNPISVNNGFFQDCGGNGQACGACPFGTGPLAGTGMDQVSGGGTEWLTTTAPIVPGETMTLELTIFDVSDHIYDSLILLDNFQWSLDPSSVGTTG
jgi:hypothetical protein